MGNTYYNRTSRTFYPRNTRSNNNCGIILAITLHSTFTNLQIGYYREVIQRDKR